MGEVRIDVSEIKTRRDCLRKWALSSRNYYHIKPRAENPVLNFGSTFHEALAELYFSHKPVEETVQKYVDKISDDGLKKTMKTMLSGYVSQVLPADLARYIPLDSEYHFRMKLPDNLTEGEYSWAKDLTLCGSIDLILYDRETNAIVGFEHKTCKNFRTPFYNSMDEQPRMYFIALNEFVEQYNNSHNTDCTNGGVYINETRKLKTRFEHNRIDPIMYSDSECERFLEGVRQTAESIYFAKSSYDNKLPEPEPGYMKCLLCDFKDACQYYGYQKPTKDSILSEFAEELEVREQDHLDEKIQNSEGEQSQ